MDGEWGQDWFDLESLKEFDEDPRWGRECNWTPDSFPHADMVVVSVDTWDEVKTALDEYLIEYPFVKMCHMSPKDQGRVVFDSPDQALQALQQSERTHLGEHLVMKRRREYTAQTRCFVSLSKLRVAIGTIDKVKVETFIRTWMNELPLFYCCLELGETEDGLEVIEINEFSRKCDPAPLTWRDDWMTLFGSETPVWLEPDARGQT